MENEEIDLRQYIQVLIKHRWLVIAGAVLAALLAFVASSLLVAPTYEATAGVLIAQTRSQITFDPRFQTVEGETSPTYYATMNQQAHRWALAALVENGAIATQVAEQLKEELDAEEQHPARLLEMVSSSLRETEGESQLQANSDFIEIKVECNDPAKAAQIANVWAEVYEDYVNDLYRKGSESYTSVQQQVVTARATYEQAEEALINFIAESRIGDLKRQISEKQRFIDEQQQLIDHLQANKQAAFAEASQAEQSTLSHYYAASRKLRRLLEDAKALRLQIQQSKAPAAATNELALMLLKAEAFASSGDLPGNLQFQFDLSGSENPGASTQVADLEALIEVVEGRLAELDAAIAEQSSVLLGGGGYDSLEGLLPPEEQEGTVTYVAAAEPFDETIDRLREEVQQLQVELAQEEATQKELVRARDLAWETYSTLQVKVAELGIATEMMDVEVRFASPAVEPIKPTNSNTLLNTIIAAILGLILGAGTAYTLHYLYPEHDTSAAIRALLKRPRGTDQQA